MTTPAKLEAVTSRPIGIIKAGYKANPDCLIQVASIQTLIRRHPPPASLVIFDEAHHCHSQTYATVFRHYREKGAYILGCTATPARTDGRGEGRSLAAPLALPHISPVSLLPIGRFRLGSGGKISSFLICLYIGVRLRVRCSASHSI